MCFLHTEQPEPEPVPPAPPHSLLKVILGGVSGCRMSVHTVLMSSDDGTPRRKLSRIYADREEMLRPDVATVATR